MGDYPRSCDDVKKDLDDRQQLAPDFVPKPIGTDAVLHRLVKPEEIDPQTQKPSKSSFTNHGLSVFVQSKSYPLDIAKLVEESDKFVGSVQLDPEKLREMGYEICLDPYPTTRYYQKPERAKTRSPLVLYRYSKSLEFS